MAKKVLKSYDTSGKFKEKYDAGDRSYEIVYSYVEALNKASKPSLRISNDYLKSNPEISEEQKLKFYHVATVDADSKIFDMMVENKSAIIDLIGTESFDKKVESACNNTVKKAIEYETKSLLEEAIKKSSALSKGDKEYSLNATMTYAKSMKDSELYATAAKNLSKIYLKGDVEKVNDIILTLHKVFGADNSMLELSKDISKKYFKKAKSVTSALAYSKTLMLLEDYSGAQKVLEKGMKNAEKAGENTRTIQMMLKVVEQKKA